ncbi:MAG: SGNH/GDSL hydrolase family protein [Firmicutes bacterium]|nr:SGNH/GDSL hydrolase family protein [Bacillota bacterium]
MNLENKTIAFLGDSITEGAGATEYKNCFVEVFSRMTHSKTINYGIGGTRIAPQTKPSIDPIFDKDFIMRVDVMEKDVDVVVVFGGTNDFGHGDAPFGELSDAETNTFCGSCDILMNKLVNKYPSKQIVFITPLHRLSEENTVNEIGIECKLLADYVYAIKKKAEKYSIQILDLYAVSGMQPKVEAQNKLYFADGLHPNDCGHKKIAEMIKQFLETNLL